MFLELTPEHAYVISSKHSSGILDGQVDMSYV